MHRFLAIQMSSRKIDEKCQIFMAGTIRHRGWFYPHVTRREWGKVYNMDRCVESWTRWGEFAEVFQFYRSGQFIHHIGMVEDRYGDSVPIGMEWVPGLESPAPKQPFLMAESALYYLTEIYLFASNLAARKMLGPEADVNISLYNQAGRILSFEGQSPFFTGDGAVKTQTVELGHAPVTADRLRDEHDAMAVEDGLRLVEACNVPTAGLGDAMREWQADFYRRKF